MIAKTMLVFYGADCLPYKDKERKVHYPIIEPAFQGSSQANEIKFYIDQIGGDSLQWIAVSKLPNGKIGAQTLTTNEDENGQYALLPLTSWYTQAKGDLYISLRGYDGGAEIIYDEDTGMYKIEGNPVVQSTGSVKITIRYSTPLLQDDETQEITLQELLAAIGLKLNKNAKVYLRYYEDFITGAEEQTLPASLFVADTIVYDYTTSSFYHIDSIVLPDDPNNVTTVGATYTLIQSPFSVDATLSTTSTNPIQNKAVTIALNNKVDKISDNGDYVYTHSGTTQGQIPYSRINTANAIVRRTSGADISVPPIPGDTSAATSKYYVDQAINNLREVAEGKCKSIVISYNTPTPTALTFEDHDYFKPDGTQIESFEEFEEYVGGSASYCDNSIFNSQSDAIDVGHKAVITMNYVVYILDEELTILKTGDIILVFETDVPDRWFDATAYACKLETSKVPLEDYYAKNASIIPTTSGFDIGASGKTFKDLYLTGILTNETVSYSIAESFGALFNKLANGTNVIKWSELCLFDLTTNTQFSFETPKASSVPEYKAIINNNGSSSITLTFTGVTNILCNDDDCVITNGSDSMLVLPAGVSIEISVLDNMLIAVNFEAQ